jgi:hypothetical protein
MRMRSRLNLAYRGVRARTHDGKRIRAKVQAVSTLSAILALVVSGSAWLADQRLNLDVNDPRPLAAALEQLEKRHGWVITYDDPPYLYAPDIEDVTLAVRRDGDITRRVLVPRGGRFRFEYSAPADGGAPNAALVLERLLEEYHLTGYPGMFRVIATGTVFHVVPSESRNASGVLAPSVSLLDAKISIPDSERSVFSTVTAIVEAASRQLGARVGLGTVPVNLLMQRRVHERATNESARTVLMRTLASTHRQLSWRLFCDPGASAQCSLNLHLVE